MSGPSERLTETMLQALLDSATSVVTVCRLCNERKCPGCPMDVFGALG